MSYKEFTGKNPPKLADYRAAVFMNVLREHLVPLLSKIAPTRYTFGLYTRRQRKEWGLEKSHINDALTITKVKPVHYSDNVYYIKQVRKKKRLLHEEIPRKGRKEPNRESKRNNKNTKQITYKGLTWCLWDKVKVGIETGFISGFTGNMVYVQGIDGKYLQVSLKYKQISVDKITLISRNNNWLITKMAS